MNDAMHLRLTSLVTVWSDGRGMTHGMTLADQYRHLLPKRITNAQLAGLNGVAQGAMTLGQITAFAQHQGIRAARAGRMDVKGYWDALHQIFEGLEEDAATLATRSGVTFPAQGGKGREQQKAPAWLTTWLAKELVQHLVAHSLYLGTVSKLGANGKSE